MFLQLSQTISLNNLPGNSFITGRLGLPVIFGKKYSSEGKADKIIYINFDFSELYFS